MFVRLEHGAQHAMMQIFSLKYALEAVLTLQKLFPTSLFCSHLSKVIHVTPVLFDPILFQLPHQFRNLIYIFDKEKRNLIFTIIYAYICTYKKLQGIYVVNDSLQISVAVVALALPDQI